MYWPKVLFHVCQLPSLFLVQTYRNLIFITDLLYLTNQTLTLGTYFNVLHFLIVIYE